MVGHRHLQAPPVLPEAVAIGFMTAVPEQVTRPFERLTGESIHATTPTGIQQLAVNQVPESDQLDYKIDAYDGTAGKSDKKDELRGDVTALASLEGRRWRRATCLIAVGGRRLELTKRAVCRA